MPSRKNVFVDFACDTLTSSCGPTLSCLLLHSLHVVPDAEGNMCMVPWMSHFNSCPNTEYLASMQATLDMFIVLLVNIFASLSYLIKV